MPRFCVDASFVLARLIPSTPHLAAIARWNSVQPPDELVAPPLLLAESTSVLSEYVYRRQMPADEARRLIVILVRLDIRMVDTLDCYERAFDISRSLGWAKTYDALYLAAAEREGAEMLTVDRGMQEAAARLGIRSSLVG